MGQYEKFLSFENFKLAFARIVRSPRNEYKEFYDKDCTISTAFFFML